MFGSMFGERQPNSFIRILVHKKERNKKIVTLYHDQLVVI